MACTHSCSPTTSINYDPRYRQILWLALIINATMFAIEVLGSISTMSTALLADSLDFLGDAANYGISLFVLSKTLHTRAKASMLKAATLFGFGLFVLGNMLWHWQQGTVPQAPLMGGIAIMALMANMVVAWMLYHHRHGDSNRQSVWLCSRNDAIGNLAVVLAAVLVWFTSSGYPDWLVSALMAYLALSASLHIFRQAQHELAQPTADHPH